MLLQQDATQLGQRISPDIVERERLLEEGARRLVHERDELHRGDVTRLSENYSRITICSVGPETVRLEVSNPDLAIGARGQPLPRREPVVGVTAATARDEDDDRDEETSPNLPWQGGDSAQRSIHRAHSWQVLSE